MGDGVDLDHGIVELYNGQGNYNMENVETQEQEEKLLEKFNQARKRIVRNRLLLVSILNVITFLAFIFAMAFYEWIWVEIKFKKGRFDERVFVFWINLLYMKEDVNGSPYEHFATAEHRVCDNDIYCLAVFYEFTFVGYLCFCIILAGMILQLFDFARMLYFVVKSGKIMETKDNFRHLVTIFTYVIGLSLSAFSIEIISPFQFKFGVSFWIGVATLCCFVAVIIYEQFSIRKMIQQSLILDLIDKEKKIRVNQIKQNIEISRQEESIRDEEGLTL